MIRAHLVKATNELVEVVREDEPDDQEPSWFIAPSRHTTYQNDLPSFSSAADKGIETVQEAVPESNTFPDAFATPATDPASASCPGVTSEAQPLHTFS